MSDVTLVDFVENAAGMSIKEVEEEIRTRPHQVLAQRESVLGALESVWSGTDLASQRLRELQGELWPVLPTHSADVVAMVQSRVHSGARIGASRRGAEATLRDMQSLLLYAHGIHLPNPLAKIPRDDHGPEYLRALRTVCVTAPLIRGGVIRVHDPVPMSVPMPASDLAESIEHLAERIGLGLRNYLNSRYARTSQTREAGRTLLARASQHLADIGTRRIGSEGSVLLPTVYDKPAVRALIALLRKGDQPSGKSMSINDGMTRLEHLLTLQLPGLKALPLKDMVDIRQDVSFGVFRSDVSSALLSADSDLQTGRVHHARRIMSEHMDAGLSRLNAGTTRGAIGDAAIGPTVGWGLGAAVVGSTAGYIAALAALFGEAFVDVLRARPTKGEAALRVHYVELGASSLSGSERDVEFDGLDMDDLLGAALGADRELKTRQGVVSGLLTRIKPRRGGVDG